MSSVAGTSHLLSFFALRADADQAKGEPDLLAKNDGSTCFAPRLAMAQRSLDLSRAY